MTALPQQLCCFRQQVRLGFSSLCERAHLHKQEMSNVVSCRVVPCLALERRSSSHQFVHQISGRGGTVFAHQPGSVYFYRAVADGQRLADFLAGHTF